MDVWEEIEDVIRSDFSDVHSAGGIVRLALRLLMAAALGGALGFEREKKGKAAGIKTHMLVALGAALFILIPQQAGLSGTDLTRVLQGLIAGIGFLGAGAIIKADSEGQVQGLTTAAGIWLTAAIGVAAGMGLEATAVLSTLFALAIFYTGPMIARLFGKR
jgi:putative Mg2+ transporter-C (MgtC) family protein